MKKILLITTGGTITSQMTADGLKPGEDNSSILDLLAECDPDNHYEHRALCNIDSTNIQPEHWCMMAKCIDSVYRDYDGIILTHGTDTLGYTAAALSFMLLHIPTPVTLTGSQIPMAEAASDARNNLYTAIQTIEHGIKGVTVSFNHKVISGTRAVKTNTLDVDAFESINLPYLGQVYDDGFHEAPEANSRTETYRFTEALCPDVFILKVFPGLSPAFVDAVLKSGCKGLIVEAFGLGNISCLHRDLTEVIEKAVRQEIPVVVCSQCLHERCDLTRYEVGRCLQRSGAISGNDMTTEAATAKLMWALSKSGSVEEIRAIFNTNYVNEVTIRP
ncbi:MAG: asparaginase [Clostridiales Family XIII bacterium]|jgi:L-asparaginase|nr:asparaginase [Clostridiales Family XIII bacterium]